MYYVFFLLLATVAVGMYLTLLGGQQAKAGQSANGNFKILPLVNGTDNLIGATNATWVFSVTTSAALAPGDVVAFVVPSGLNAGPFSLTSVTTTAFSNVVLYSNATTTPGVVVGNNGTTVFGFVSSTIATSTAFSITLGGISNATGQVSSLVNIAWSLLAGTPSSTFAQNGTMVTTKMSEQATEGLVRGGGAIVSDLFSNIIPLSYATSATNVTYLFTFHATSSIPVGGKIVINFPSSYDLSSASTTIGAFANPTGVSKAVVAAMTTTTGQGTNRVILTTGTNTTTAGDLILLSIRVNNPATVGAYRPFSVFTTKPNNGLLDGSYAGFENGDYSFNPPVDTVHIGGTNRIVINVLKETATSTVALSGSELTSVLVGVGCPDKQFFVGNKWLGVFSSVTLSNLLDCNYMIGTPPANSSDHTFFNTFLEPAFKNITASNGTTVTTSIIFGLPDTTTTFSLTNGVPGQQGFIQAFSPKFQSFTPVFTDTTYTTPGFDNSGVGYARIRLKSGQNWGFSVSGGSFGGGSNFSTGTTKFWPPSIPSVNITASGTLNLGAFPFVAASNTLNVTLAGDTGSGITNACIGVKRNGGGFFMGFQDMICQANNGSAYQFRVPTGNLTIGVMRPGFQPDEYAIGISAATTNKTIIISAPTNYITVVVQDGSGTALNGAPVFAESSSGGSFTQGMTGSTGSTTLYVQPGTYSVRGFAPGFGPLTAQSATVSSGSNPTVTFTVAASSFRMITGRVFIDANGNSTFDSGTDTAISGFKVGARGTGSTSGGNGAETMSDGTYTLYVPSGTYAVGGWSEDTGGLADQTVNVSSGNATGVNFAVAAQSTLQITVTNASNLNTLFAGAFNTSTGRGNGTDSWTTSGSSKVARINLPAGTYEVRVGSPSIGEIGTTTTIVTSSAVTSVSFNAQANVSLVRVSGTVSNGSSNIEGATVWASRLAGPGFFSTTTDSNGSYSLLVPASRTYMIGVRAQGYVLSGGDQQVAVGSSNAIQNFTLTSAGSALVGQVTGGGTALSGAWVSAKRANTSTDYWTGGQTDASGNFSLSVDSGSWIVYAEGPCYFRSSGTTIVAGAASTSIALTATSGCTQPSAEVNAITPASGGQINSDGLIVNIPANALGTSQSSVSLSVGNAGLVVGSTNATPLSGSVKSISASNSSGQSITSLNSSVSVTLTYTQTDLPIGFDESTLQFGYWNETTGQWEAVAGTVDTANNTITASVSHFTDYGPILPGVPSAPTGLTATAASASQIDLSWTAEPTATYYSIYRNTTGTTTFSAGDLVATTTAVTYSNTGLSVATAYYYEVAGGNANGEGLNSTMTGATTTAASSSAGGGSSGSVNSPVSATSEQNQPALPSSPAPVQPETVTAALALNTSNPVTVGGVHHTVRVTDVSSVQVTVVIQSDPVTVVLNKNVSQDVDTNADGLNDMRVVYRGLAFGEPKVEFTNLTDAGELQKAATINAGSYETSNRQVVVWLNVSNTIQFALSNAPEFGEAVFMPMRATTTWRLTAGDGDKTLYVKLRSVGGGTVVATDMIRLVGQGFAQVPAPAAPTSTPANICALPPEHAYKHRGASAVYYITKKCTKQAFTQPRIFFSYFDAWSDVTVVDEALLNSIPDNETRFMPWGPKYDPKYGAVVKVITDPRVYLLLGPQKQWIISDTIFTGLGYAWNWIEDVAQNLLDKYADAGEVKDAAYHPNYTIIKYSGSPHIYRLMPDSTDLSKQVKRRIMNVNAFKKFNLRADRVITVPKTEIYPDGPAIDEQCQSLEC